MQWRALSCTIRGTTRSGGTTNNLIFERQDVLKFSGCVLYTQPFTHATSEDSCVRLFCPRYTYFFPRRMRRDLLALCQAGIRVLCFALFRPRQRTRRYPITCTQNTSAAVVSYVQPFESLTCVANSRFCGISMRISGVSMKTLFEAGRSALRPGLSWKRSGRT